MDQIDILLTRGVDRIFPSKETLESVLRSGKKLRLYQGFDPTGTQLHIGHMIGLRKLRQFQQLGHKVIFLIGDFTGRIGDPTGKTQVRKPLTQQQVKDNAKEYQRQAGKILRFTGENAVEIKFNSEWLSKLTFEDAIRLSYHFTAQQMIERDMFQQRLKSNSPISLVEFLYPLMVTYDAAVMNVDLELGGSDQMFNMTVGRAYLKREYNKDKFAMTTPLLADSKGVKIGKSEGNVIGLTDQPNDLYGKIMALGDDIILKGFEFLTDTPMEEIEHMAKKMKSGENPMTFKKQLAHALVSQLHSIKQANEAQAFFESTFQKHEVTGTDIPTFNPSKNKLAPIDLLVETHLVASRTDARRLLDQKAIEIDGVTIIDKVTPLDLTSGMVIKVGKSRFIKII